MPRDSNQLLLPVNTWFMWGSVIVALALNLLPLGRLVQAPDWLALAFVFWNIHQPLRMGMLPAFLFGLIMDIHQGSLLGQHALAYTLLSYLAITIHRRLLWFTLASQAIQILPLFAAAHLASLVIRLLAGGIWPGWQFLLAPVLEAMLWPIINMILLAPQRRPPDRDKNRPL